VPTPFSACLLLYLELLLVCFKDRQSVLTLLNCLSSLYYHNSELVANYLVPVLQLVKEFQLEHRVAGFLYRLEKRDGQEYLR
jgi:hypothetical protein